MFCMEYAAEKDIASWLQLDHHISKEELELKIRNHRGYLIKDDNTLIGVLRYNLFWDNIPFLPLICLKEFWRGKGFGRQAVLYWEGEMKKLGYNVVMTFAQSDENAQNFYRKLGYQDNGCMIFEIPSIRQPLEIFLIKQL